MHRGTKRRSTKNSCHVWFVIWFRNNRAPLCTYEFSRTINCATHHHRGAVPGARQEHARLCLETDPLPIPYFNIPGVGSAHQNHYWDDDSLFHSLLSRSETCLGKRKSRVYGHNWPGCHDTFYIGRIHPVVYSSC